MSQVSFFQIGGALSLQVNSYIKRPADDELFNMIQAGTYCYILASRQVGKSSLMIHTAARLQKNGIRTAIVDLNQFGTTNVSQESWYYSFLNRLVRQWRLPVNLGAWWAERDDFTFTDRFISFLQDVVITKIECPVAIFIDEIDTTLRLNFSDDFFAAIRTIYNRQAEIPELNRLTFVLIGVATPLELIKDPNRTPFNVGQQLEMTDFTLEEAVKLVSGFKLPPNEARQVLEWVLEWTAGHPYLTQRLCREISHHPQNGWKKLDIDDLVEDIFFGKKGEEDSNLAFVRDWLAIESREVDTTEVLSLYGDILLAPFPDDESSETASHLKLSGIVCRDNQGILRVRNRIYERVFDYTWLTETEAVANAGGSRALAQQRKLREALAQQARAATRFKWTAILVIVIGVIAGLFAVTAAIERNEALHQAEIARSRQLAAQALNHLNELDLALLLSLEANRLSNAPEVRGSLLSVLQSNAHLARYLHGHSDIVTSVAFNPDGQKLVSGSRGGTILLWDVSTGRAIPQILGDETNGIHSLAYGSNGQLLASGSVSQTVIIWDVSSGQLFDLPNQHKSAVTNAAFSPDGQKLASSDDNNNTIILWDVAGRQQISQLHPNHTTGINSLAFSPDGKILATGSSDNLIILSNVDTGEPIGQPLRGHDSVVQSLTFSPDGTLLASGGKDRQIILWDVETGASIGSPLVGHTSTVWSLDFSHDGQILASGGEDQAIILWEVEPGPGLGQSLTGHESSIQSVAFRPDGTILASGGEDNGIFLWKTEDWSVIGTPLISHTRKINDLAFSPDGAVLASASSDGNIILWDSAEGDAIGQLSGEHTNEVHAVAFSPNGKVLASGSMDHKIILWDIETSKSIGSPLTGHTDGVESVAFSPDGKMLASGSWDRRVALWDLSANKGEAQFLGHHNNWVHSIAFSPDGQTLASGTADNRIIFWDVTGGQQLADRSFKGHRNEVDSVAFSPDGQILASSDRDDLIILWDVATGQLIGPLVGHTGWVWNVAFSPDGQRLASGSSDGTVIVWDINIESWKARACSIANRSLTKSEWEQFIGPSITYQPTC